MTGFTGFRTDPITVLFENGDHRQVLAHKISRFWEGEYHLVREPIPDDDYEYLQDTFGHWRALRKTIKCPIN